MGSGTKSNKKTGDHLINEDQAPELYPVITNSGARKALNFILDVLKERKNAATFVWSSSEGKLIETSSGKEIEVVFRPKEGE